MKFLLVFILTIQTVYSSSDEFNEYLKSLQSQFKVISLSKESLLHLENELKKDFQFMSSNHIGSHLAKELTPTIS